MEYPTLEQVEKADRLQLARWYRFLKSPGCTAIGTGWSYSDFEKQLREDTEILDRINVRLTELGGMNSSISKCIGWG